MKIGSLDISKVMVGSDEVTVIYAGLDLVYSGGTTPPTPTGSCISESEGTWVSLDEYFDQTTFPLEVYKLDFGGLNTSSLGYGGTNSTGLDLYDANNNYIGQVLVGWDNDQQFGDLEVYSGSTAIYTRSSTSSALDVVDICTLFGSAVYIQDVPSVEVCGMYDCVDYDCLEWDEETGECIEQGECLMQECVMTETIYPLSVLYPSEQPQTLQWVTFANGDTIPSDLQIYGIKGIVNDLIKVFYDDDILFELNRNKYNVYIGGNLDTCYTENDILSNTSVEYTFSDIGCSDSYTVSSRTIANLTNDIQLLIYA